MSLTRRQLVVRSGAAAVWATAGGALVADRLGAFDEAPPFDRAPFPSPGRSATAVLRAERYDGDLEGLLLDGLRLVDADVRDVRSCSSRTSSSSSRDTSVNTDPRVVIAAANALRRLGASSVVVAEGPGHRRDTEAVVVATGLREALDDAEARVRRPQRGAGRPHAAPERGTPSLRELWVPTAAARGRRRRLDAEAEDAPLGRGHAVAQELLRLHAGTRLRMAEGRLPRPERASRTRSSTSPGRAAVARDRRRHRRDAGRRAARGATRSRRRRSSSLATRSPPTSPRRDSWAWIRRRSSTSWRRVASSASRARS